METDVLNEELVLELQNLYSAKNKLGEALIKLMKVVRPWKPSTYFCSSLEMRFATRLCWQETLTSFNYSPSISSVNLIDELVYYVISRMKFTHNDLIQTLLILICLNGLMAIYPLDINRRSVTPGNRSYPKP